jgi:CRISPR-associated protein Csb2
MIRFLVLSIRFLDDRYHGLTDHGEKAEWPPSPFRLFQAIVAGNARGTVLPDGIKAALKWLEGLDNPPLIVAPVATEGLERLTYVINNYSHKDANSRAPKTIRPMLLNGDRHLQYAWSFDADAVDAMTHAKAIISATRHIRCLGWGIDMVFGTGAIVDELPTAMGTRRLFRPSFAATNDGVALRTPTVGSLLSLERNYADFIKRYETPGVTRMESVALFAPVTYLADSSRPWAAFRLLDPETGRLRSFSATRAVTVAGMIRGAAHAVAKKAGRDPKWVKEFVCGHHEGSDSFPRFSYLPLPSIQPVVGVGRISRVLIAEPVGSAGQEVAWIKRLLTGQTAKSEQSRDALLVRLTGDGVLNHYVRSSQTWTTVTPVALPGSDDGMTRKTAKLLDRLLCHAGYSSDAIQDLEYHRVPFLRGAEDAKRYQPRGDHYLANCTMYHMRLRWKHAVKGPIALGAGRHCGLGIFAATNS